LPTFADLAKAIDAAAPHYDMTRPHEGLRVLEDSLVNLGFGYVAEAAPTALRILAARRPGAAQMTGAKTVWGAYAGNTGNPLFTWEHPPPGVEVPGWLASRVIRAQENSVTCVQASARMIIENMTGKLIPEAHLAEQCEISGTFERNKGSYFFAAARQMFSEFNVPFTEYPSWELGSLEEAKDRFADLYIATKTGNPAIVQILPNGSAHAVVVDHIVEQGGHTWVLIRDPWPMTHTSSPIVGEFFEAAGWTGKQILSGDEFFKSWSGSMITTRKP